MKKGILILCVLASFSFASCKKCMTCQLQAGATVVSYPEEKCGTQRQLDDFEKLYKDRASEYPVAGTRAVCTTK